MHASVHGASTVHSAPPQFFHVSGARDGTSFFPVFGDAHPTASTSTDTQFGPSRNHRFFRTNHLAPNNSPNINVQNARIRIIRSALSQVLTTSNYHSKHANHASFHHIHLPLLPLRGSLKIINRRQLHANIEATTVRKAAMFNIPRPSGPVPQPPVPTVTRPRSQRSLN